VGEAGGNGEDDDASLQAAIAMSMAEAQASEQPAAASGQPLQDPSFVQSVLTSLPGARRCLPCRPARAPTRSARAPTPAAADPSPPIPKLSPSRLALRACCRAHSSARPLLACARRRGRERPSNPGGARGRTSPGR
jgi:hypothetical protein